MGLGQSLSCLVALPGGEYTQPIPHSALLASPQSPLHRLGDGDEELGDMGEGR